MRKLFFGAILLVVITMFPVISIAGVSVRIDIPLPPPIPFLAPPNLIVLPGTDIYAVPDIEDEIFFRNGWWWRRWDNRWYRSRYYDHGWGYFQGYPTWYGNIPHDWRDNYRNHVWYGRPWNYHYIPHGDLDRHWRGGYWRTDHGWGPPPPGPRLGGPPPPPGPGPVGRGRPGRAFGPGGPPPHSGPGPVGKPGKAVGPGGLAP